MLEKNCIFFRTELFYVVTQQATVIPYKYLGGQDIGPEPSIRNYHNSLRYNQEGLSHLFRGKSQKSGSICFFKYNKFKLNRETELVQDRDRWLELVNAVMNNAGYFIH